MSASPTRPPRPPRPPRGAAAPPAVPPPGRLGDEEVVHHADPRAARRRPRPEHRREAERRAGLRVARDELDALALGIRDQRAAQREQRLVTRAHGVEVAVRAHEREQVAEVGLADRGDRRPRLGAHCAMPPNWPPVMLRTWPWT